MSEYSLQSFSIITSAKEVTFYSASVCLFVYMLTISCSKTTDRILHENSTRNVSLDKEERTECD